MSLLSLLNVCLPRADEYFWLDASTLTQHIINHLFWFVIFMTATWCLLTTKMVPSPCKWYGLTQNPNHKNYCECYLKSWSVSPSMCSRSRWERWRGSSDVFILIDDVGWLLAVCGDSDIGASHMHHGSLVGSDNDRIRSIARWLQGSFRCIRENKYQARSLKPKVVHSPRCVQLTGPRLQKCCRRSVYTKVGPLETLIIN